LEAVSTKRKEDIALVKQEKLESIVNKHLGQIFKFTIDFKVDDRTKLTILYEDSSGAFYEYKIIINFRSKDIEFIKHKGISLRQEMVKPQIKAFDLEMFEFMVAEIYNG
jgi:hypothetical protein